MKTCKFLFVLTVFCSMFLCCSEANAVIRIGTINIWISDESSSSFNGKYEKLFSDKLPKTGLFELITYKKIAEVVTDLAHSGRETDAMKGFLEAGRLEKCRYLFSWHLRMKKKDPYSAEIISSLIDILTGETINLNDKVTLQPSSEELPLSKRSKMSQRKQKQDKNGIKVLREQLIAKATNQTVERLLEDIAGNSPMVTGFEGDSVVLNRGEATGVKQGDSYKVYAEVSDGTEDIFGTDYTEGVKTDLAFIKIKEVRENSSVAEILQNAGNINAIQVGDKFTTVPNSEVQKVISEIASGSRQSFPSDRPSSQKVAIEVPASQQKQPNASSAVAALPPLTPGTIRIGIVKFENKADNILDKEVGAITDLCTRFLSNSDKIAVIEKDKLETIAREHRLNLSGMVDVATAAQIGKLATCQYILMGSVTDIVEYNTEESNYTDPTGFSGKTRDVILGLGLLQSLIGGGLTDKKEHNVSVTIDARLINTTTSKIEFALQETGFAKQTSISTEKVLVSYSKKEDRGGIQSQAVDYAAANLGLEVIAKLTEEHTRVSAVNDDEIIVNIGSSSGVHAGDLLCLSNADAILSAREVQPDFSITELVFAIPENHKPQPGEIIVPRLYNDFDKDILINACKKIKKSPATSTQKSTKKSTRISSAGRKPDTFDKSKFELSSTDTKKVIKSYGLNAKEEKTLLEAHSKASKMSNTEKKYEAYVKLAQSTLYDYLASYNAAKYAMELSMSTRAMEWIEKTLLINPEYKPAKALMTKIKRSKQ